MHKIMNYETLKEYIYKNLDEGEIFIFSISLRKKYLTTEERKQYSFSDSFFDRRILTYSKDKNILYRKIDEIITTYKLKIENNLYNDRDGKIIPKKCISIYISTNPSSIKRCNIQIGKELFENINLNIESRFKSNAQKYQNKKYIDIDIDIYNIIGNSEIEKEILDKISEKMKIDYIIETKNGFHILINKETINFNYPKFLKELDNKIKQYNERNEIEYKNGKMLPLNKIIEK